MYDLIEALLQLLLAGWLIKALLAALVLWWAWLIGVFIREREREEHMTIRQELEDILINHRYFSSMDGRSKRLMPHHVKALLNDLEPYVVRKTDKYRQAIMTLAGHSGRGGL